MKEDQINSFDAINKRCIEVLEHSKTKRMTLKELAKKAGIPLHYVVASAFMVSKHDT